MWNLPGPGIEPVPRAPAGGFLSTVTPGKSQGSSFSIFLIIKICLILFTTTFRGIKIDSHNMNCACVCMLLIQSCPTPCNPMYCSPPGSSDMEFSRKEKWSELPFLSPGDLLDPRIESRSPAFQTTSLPSEPPGFMIRAIKNVFLLLFVSGQKQLLPSSPSCECDLIKQWFGHYYCFT